MFAALQGLNRGVHVPEVPAAAEVGDVSVTFTRLTNDGQVGVIRAVLGMLKSAARVAS